MKNLYIIGVDNTIDLITNSSSELFVIKGDKQKAAIVEMMNEAFKARGLDITVRESSLDEQFSKTDRWYDPEWDKQNLKENFPEEKHHLIDELFSVEEGKCNFYGYTFDRDEESRLDYQVHEALVKIGFEFMGSDY